MQADRPNRSILYPPLSVRRPNSAGQFVQNNTDIPSEIIQPMSRTSSSSRHSDNSPKIYTQFSRSMPKSALNSETHDSDSFSPSLQRPMSTNTVIDESIRSVVMDAAAPIAMPKARPSVNPMLQHNEQPIIPEWNAVGQPLVVNRPSMQSIVFKQPVNIRYLKPPTPPPPGNILIRELRPAPPPPLPPQVIRQRMPRPRTPEPLVVREVPPHPPKPLKPVLIEKHLPMPPPPPRQVIVERYKEPRRPRKLIFEKWLQYKPAKRKIILEKAPELPPQQPIRNVIIEYSSPMAVALPEYKVEGVFTADPLTYTYSPYEGELQVVDRIYDLPNVPSANPEEFIRNLQNGVNRRSLSANSR